MTPIYTLKNLLVHPKNKIEQLHTYKCVYEIPRKNCKKTYVGEIYQISLKMPMYKKMKMEAKLLFQERIKLRFKNKFRLKVLKLLKPLLYLVWEVFLH